jgi:hypothetical protein
MTIIIVGFASFMLILTLKRALKRARFDRKVRKSVQRELKKEARRNVITASEKEKMLELSFDERFLADAGVHPYSWIGKPQK